MLTAAWAADIVLRVDPMLAGGESVDERFSSVSSAVAHVTRTGRTDNLIFLLEPGLYVENNTVALSCTDSQAVSLTSTGLVFLARRHHQHFVYNTSHPLLSQTLACRASLFPPVVKVHYGRY